MPKRRIDWVAVLRAWVAAKASNSSISKSQFFRDQGLVRRAGLKKIGRKMDTVWAQVQERTQRRIADDISLDLAREFRQVFKGSKAVFTAGLKELVATGKDGEVILKPKSAGEATLMIRAGLQGMVDPAKIITGGEPLVTETVTRPRFNWHPPKGKRTRRTRPRRRKKKSSR